jgi:hypothetical protein
MSVRPVLLKDIRRTAIRNHQQNIGKDSYNRFEPLTPRERTFSASKRPRSEDLESVQVPKTPKLDSNVIFSQMTAQENAIKEAKTLVSELETLNGKPENNPDPRFACITKVLLLLVTAHESLASAVLDSTKLNGSDSAFTTGKKFQTAGGRNNPPPKKAPVISEEEALKAKVKKTLKEAEKKTLIFNLDLGTSQMMNKDSIARKVTMSMANLAKKGDHDYNISDAEDVIDDILSCSKLEFLGNATKKYFNKRNVNDPKNDTMYTVPVRMDFKDKDTKIKAETSLRKICKVSCTTPYPKKLRTLLGEVIKEGKTKCPNTFIRTRVNIDKLTIEAHAKTGDGWVDLNIIKDIPLNILDNNPLAPSQMVTDEEDEEVNLS